MTVNKITTINLIIRVPLFYNPFVNSLREINMQDVCHLEFLTRTLKEPIIYLRICTISEQSASVSGQFEYDIFLQKVILYGKIEGY